MLGWNKFKITQNYKQQFCIDLVSNLYIFECNILLINEFQNKKMNSYIAILALKNGCSDLI